jgi:hypothetical protein
MADRGKGFADRLVESGTRIVARAVETVLKDPRGQDAVARAVGLAQRGRQTVEALQERVLKATGVPVRQDYQDLAKQLARIKRKARELARKLEDERRVAAEKRGDGTR